MLPNDKNDVNVKNKHKSIWSKMKKILTLQNLKK